MVHSSENTEHQYKEENMRNIIDNDFFLNIINNNTTNAIREMVDQRGISNFRETCRLQFIFSFIIFACSYVLCSIYSFFSSVNILHYLLKCFFMFMFHTVLSFTVTLYRNRRGSFINNEYINNTFIIGFIIILVYSYTIY